MQARRTDSACLSPRTIRAERKETTMQDLELIAFQIISNVGSARSAFVNAIRAAKAGDFARAEKLIEEGETDFLAGHKAHQQLLTDEAAGTAAPVTLLLAHAEDQFMSAEAFKILAREFIDLYQRVEEKAPR